MYDLNKAKEELREINNVLSFYMKKKRAIQDYILEENDRIKNIASSKTKAWELKHDTEFIQEHGRERTIEEVARLMSYSPRQIQRFLKEKDS